MKLDKWKKGKLTRRRNRNLPIHALFNTEEPRRPNNLHNRGPDIGIRIGFWGSISSSGAPLLWLFEWCWLHGIELEMQRGMPVAGVVEGRGDEDEDGEFGGHEFNISMKYSGFI